MQKKAEGNNRIRKIFNIAFVVFLAYFAVSLLFENVSFLNRYEHFVIVSDSMEPTIDVGDIVIINNAVSVESLEFGDIIAFDALINNQEVTVVHYIHTINDNNGSLTVRTIAENATSPDDWVLTTSDITGLYQFRIPAVGRFLLFAQSTVGRIVIIMDVILIYVLYRMFFKKD